MNNDTWDDYKSEIKKAKQVAIKKFDETCEKIAKNEPKIWLTVEDAKFISKLLPMSILWCGMNAYEAIKELNDKLKQQIEQAEDKDA